MVWAILRVLAFSELTRPILDKVLSGIHESKTMHARPSIGRFSEVSLKLLNTPKLGGLHQRKS